MGSLTVRCKQIFQTGKSEQARERTNEQEKFRGKGVKNSVRPTSVTSWMIYDRDIEQVSECVRGR